MLRILHTADIHLGARFAGLGNKGDSQREQLRTTFRKIISIAVEEGVNIVLIAGDLFDANQQSQRNIDLVIEQFNLLKDNGIPVCLVPGTHDPLDASSVYKKVDFEGRCPNLHIFSDQNMSHREYADLDLTVYGKPNLSNRSRSSPLLGLKPATSTRFHIAIAHGSFHIPDKIADDDHVFMPEEIRSSGMHYLALGHWHRSYRCWQDPPAWYAGPPEWIPDQRERGSVLMVTLADSGEVKVEPRRLGLRDYDEIEVDVSGVPDLAALRARIGEGAHENLVRRATLKGLRGAELIVDAEELQAELAGSFFHLAVADRSHPGMREISEDRAGLVRSEFIRLAKERIEASQGEEQAIAESALQYGLALLDGKDVLS
jgi:DNA repair protein SbcD/Mre11